MIKKLLLKMGLIDAPYVPPLEIIKTRGETKKKTENRPVEIVPIQQAAQRNIGRSNIVSSSCSAVSFPYVSAPDFIEVTSIADPYRRFIPTYANAEEAVEKITEQVEEELGIKTKRDLVF